ncbi:hypothetical protein HQN64_10480 [Enterobacteriaceae bacterium BIT-l23]|jgi:hypothetical protein|uniref:Uncharacterized protein n=1 Tax=Jejubacter calystegiae TaxID=2579935 RepID=A0A4P8YMX1_9ENTR|nr:hypothetical protein [Jejubacter calystegiae]NUU66535.1 hypothetical protein [Enterobacteriaceae bacterium BIT-l23]QCT21533.1 hypothetical protein FEM41_18680 [Jejubacter calystegiae]
MIWRTILLTACIISSSCVASSSEWKVYIQLIERADNKALQAFPGKIDIIGDTLDAEHTEELTTALSIALIKDPVSVINATNSLDKSADPLKQRFGTSMVCGIPIITHANQMKIEEYFAKAEPALEKAGTPAAECLSNMRDTIDEFRQEAAQNEAK